MHRIQINYGSNKPINSQSAQEKRNMMKVRTEPSIDSFKAFCSIDRGWMCRNISSLSK